MLEVLRHLNLPLVELPSSYRAHLYFHSELITETDFIELFFDDLSKLKALHCSRNEVVYYLLKTYTSQRESKPQVCQLIKKKLDDYMPAYLLLQMVLR